MPATSGSPVPASGTPQPSSGPAPGLRWRRVFPGEECQLGLLRRWLASLFPPCPARDDVAVIASELSANAIRHTASGRGGSFVVEITWSGPVVRVAVADSGAATEPHVIDDPGAEHGRGLLVVRELSMSMGVCGDHRGRLTWADVQGEASPGAEVAAPDAYEDAIRDGQAALARRFAGVPAWFGRSTLAWWADAGRASRAGVSTHGARTGRAAVPATRHPSASPAPAHRAGPRRRRPPVASQPAS